MNNVKLEDFNNINDIIITTFDATMSTTMDISSSIDKMYRDLTHVYNTYCIDITRTLEEQAVVDLWLKVPGKEWIR